MPFVFMLRVESKSFLSENFKIIAIIAFSEEEAIQRSGEDPSLTSVLDYVCVDQLGNMIVHEVNYD